MFDTSRYQADNINSSQSKLTHEKINFSPVSLKFKQELQSQRKKTARRTKDSHNCRQTIKHSSIESSFTFLLSSCKLSYLWIFQDAQSSCNILQLKISLRVEATVHGSPLIDRQQLWETGWITKSFSEKLQKRQILDKKLFRTKKLQKKWVI